MFETELICIKMDLALNNPQGLICHKAQPTNKPTLDGLTLRSVSIASPLFKHTQSWTYLFPSRYGKMVGYIGFFSLGKATSLGEGNFWILTSVVSSKNNWPFIAPSSLRRFLGKYIRRHILINFPVDERKYIFKNVSFSHVYWIIHKNIFTSTLVRHVLQSSNK